MRLPAALLASAVLATAGELHDAARACEGDRLRQLLAARPPLNELDADGLTPLHAAIEARRRGCVLLLLQAGAGREVRDRQGRTPLDAVAQLADPQDRLTFEFLLRSLGPRPPAAAKGPQPWSLEESIRRGQTDVAKMILSLGADPNTPGRDGATLLGLAALKGDAEAVRALLAKGARVNDVSTSGVQAIHEAALGDSAEVIEELLHRGAALNARTRDEAQTPLHLAAAMGREHALAALLARQADLTLRDSRGRTALETARQAELPAIAALLEQAARTR